MTRLALLPILSAAFAVPTFAQNAQPAPSAPTGCIFVAEEPLETIVYECVAPTSEAPAATAPAAEAAVPGPAYFSASPGPAIAGSIDPSQLPIKAIRFINEHFAGKKITECEREFSTNTLEVGFADGTDVEFDADGEWMEVEAGRRHVISEHMLNTLLPGKAVDELRSRHLLGRIDSVKRDGGGYKVELRDVSLDDFRFSPEGKLLSIAD